MTNLFARVFPSLRKRATPEPSDDAPARLVRVGCPAHNCGGRCLLIAHVQNGVITRLGTDDRFGGCLGIYNSYSWAAITGNVGVPGGWAACCSTRRGCGTEYEKP